MQYMRFHSIPTRLSGATEFWTAAGMLKLPLGGTAQGRSRNLQGRRAFASRWRALQFAPDQSVEAAWFGKFDTSVYGRENFMDMTDTGLQSESYDLIISNHVLEHVANDRAALIELLRVVGESGVVHLCVPSPLARWETLDWGFPDPDKNRHYRDYGADFPIGMLEDISEANAIAVVGRDTVTGLHEIVYFFSRSIETLAKMANLWERAYIAVVRFT